MKTKEKRFEFVSFAVRRRVSWLRIALAELVIFRISGKYFNFVAFRVSLMTLLILYCVLLKR